MFHAILRAVTGKKYKNRAECVYEIESNYADETITTAERGALMHEALKVLE